MAFLLEERFGHGEIEAGQGMPAVETSVNRGPEGPKGGLVGGRHPAYPSFLESLLG